MMVSLDMVVALLTGLMAFFLFLIHSMVTPQHQRWITVPLYLRLGILAVGVVLSIRSVNLIALSGRDATFAGHINWEGAAVATALFYLFGSVTFWVYDEMLKRRPARPRADTRTAPHR
jgi:hypothetical protein